MINIEYKSQIGQDKIILELLGYKKYGFFVDIGATDGVDISNTYAMEKFFDWQGICVEPNKRFFSLLKQNRNCICTNVAILNKNDTISFSPRGVLGGVNDPSITDHIKAKTKTYEVSSITITNLLKQYNAPKIIDYISLDVEGAELLILESFPFDDYRFRTMSVEHNSYMGHRQRQKGLDIIKLLEKHNYKLYKTIEQDYIIVDLDLI